MAGRHLLFSDEKTLPRQLYNHSVVRANEHQDFLDSCHMIKSCKAIIDCVEVSLLVFSVLSVLFVCVCSCVTVWPSVCVSAYECVDLFNLLGRVDCICFYSRGCVYACLENPGRTHG